MHVSRGKLSNISKRWQEAITDCLYWQPSYRWGGSNPRRGLDCSGFTLYVLGRAGYSSHLDLTADSLMRSVFKLRSPDEDLGEYANEFVAYGYWTGDAFTHIAVHYTGYLGAEVTTDAVDGEFPTTVPHTDGSGENEYSWGFVERVTKGNGLAYSERMMQFAAICAGVAHNSAKLNSLYGLDPACVGDYSDFQSDGVVPGLTTQLYAKMRSWSFDLDAVKYILSYVLGIQPAVMSAVLDDMIAHENSTFGVTGIGPGLFADNFDLRKTAKDIARFWAALNWTVINFDDLWGMVSAEMLKMGNAGPVASGVRVFPYTQKTFVDTNGALTPSINGWVKGFLSSKQLSGFLESEAYQLEDWALGSMQSVPTRRV